MWTFKRKFERLNLNYLRNYHELYVKFDKFMNYSHIIRIIFEIMNYTLINSSESKKIIYSQINHEFCHYVLKEKADPLRWLL
jgi:hypothetical protein